MPEEKAAAIDRAIGSLTKNVIYAKKAKKRSPGCPCTAITFLAEEAVIPRKAQPEVCQGLLGTLDYLVTREKKLLKQYLSQLNMELHDAEAGGKIFIWDAVSLTEGGLIHCDICQVIPFNAYVGCKRCVMVRESYTLCLYCFLNSPSSMTQHDHLKDRKDSWLSCTKCSGSCQCHSDFQLHYMIRSHEEMLHLLDQVKNQSAKIGQPPDFSKSTKTYLEKIEENYLPNF